MAQPNWDDTLPAPDIWGVIDGELDIKFFDDMNDQDASTAFAINPFQGEPDSWMYLRMFAVKDGIRDIVWAAHMAASGSFSSLWVALHNTLFRPLVEHGGSTPLVFDYYIIKKAPIDKRKGISPSRLAADLAEHKNILPSPEKCVLLTWKK
ncbi:hypothetical protein [Pseudomonas eucalypticola]|uniref:Uncharacterized protein n=1 Tax=Pseudomonas eucalypticola TaxID=2599595 RepID=A0A7D5D4Y0_9PSED|nr:hypothetical protein [Pseudomonas eucalypticola]QKZ02813.1 hypothetical protein HWQ56_02945 [Pseudomonas eucalypticola]